MPRLPSPARARELARELRSLRPALEQRDHALEQEITGLREELARQGEAFARQGDQLQELARQADRLYEAVRFVADDEDESRRTLAAVRAAPGYEQAFEESEPLVSIPIPTYRNARGLAERSIPSALAQTYENIEIVVVGDASPPEVEEAARSFDDPRVRWVNLPSRGPYPEDPDLRWLVAGTMPLNEGIRLSRGRWIAILNDDDSFRPDHVERLVALAHERHTEVAYGRMAMHHPDGTEEILGSFPPALHRFGWQMGMFHEGLRFFGYSLGASLFAEPGDWHMCRRMLRAGVRFAMTDDVLGDYYPARLWEPTS